MVTGIAFYTCQDTVVKWLTQDYSVFQIAFFRNFFALLFLLPFLRYYSKAPLLKTNHPYKHLYRAIVAFIASILFMVSLKHMPLVDVTVISFSAPFFILLLAIPILKESVGIFRFIFIIMGFLGVLIVLKPGTNIFTYYALIPLLATFFYSYSVILTRQMSGTESAFTMIFWALTIWTVFTSLTLPFVWVTPDFKDLMLLILAGVFGGLCHSLVTFAFKFSPAVVIAPFEYTALLWSILFGIIIWHDYPKQHVMVGSFVIILSCLIILHRETRKKQKA